MTSPQRFVDYVPLEDVLPATRNPKGHSDEMIQRSIRRFGFVDAAVHDGRTGRIIAGHGRTEALWAIRRAGEEPPEGVIVDEDGRWLVPVQKGWSSRSDGEAEALLVVLNRATEAGGWNEGELAELLGDLRAGPDPDLLELSGFTAADHDRMVAELAEQTFEAADDPEEFDAAPALPYKPITRVGDVWLLGKHRLVCGDSTDLHVVTTALGGKRADLAFTDPPYGVKYEGSTGLRIVNDDLSASDLGRLLVGAFQAMSDSLVAGGAFYICGPSGRLETTFRAALEEVHLELRQQIVWVKDSFVLGHSDYHLQHETLLYGWQLPGEAPTPPHFDPEHDTMLYGWKDGAAHTFEGGRKQSTVWVYPKPRRSEVHPTMKPVALVRRAILNSTLPGGLVLDQFAGSGSTLIAAELCGRVASCVELDRRYADVICRRYQEHSGVMPILEASGDPVDFTAVAQTAEADTAEPVAP